MKRLLFSFACLTFAASAQADDKTLGMVTGSKSGTYITIGREIAAAAEKSGVKVEVKESGGSIENIKRITSGENAALGIVQSDVLGFLSRSKNPDSMRIASSLRLMFPLYREEVHLFARNTIKSFADLKGKKVVIGEEGSGSMLTSINLLSIMGVTPASMMKISAPEGVVAVLRGEADAIIFVGGKPVRMFKNLDELQAGTNAQYKDMLKEVHFVPLKDPLMLEEYPPAEITPTDYAFVREPVGTLAVTSALIAYDFSSGGRQYNKERCDQILGLADAIRTNLDSLRKDGHPKWKEVDLSAKLEGWKKDGCAWPAEKPAPPDSKSLDRDLLNIVGQGVK